MKTLFAIILLVISSFSFNANANTYSNSSDRTLIATHTFTVTQSDFTIKQNKVLCVLVDKNDPSQQLAVRMGDVIEQADNTLTISITWRKLQLSWATIKECY